MPVTLTPGIAGVVNAGGAPQDANPLQGFADQLAKSKQLQKQSAMMDLEAAMKLSEFDPEAAMKIGGPALDVLHGHAKGKAGGGTPSLFHEIYGQKKAERDAAASETEAKIGQMQAATKASNAQSDFSSAQVEHENAVYNAMQNVANPDADQKLKGQSAGLLMASGRMSPEQFVSMRAYQDMTPEQLDHLSTAAYAKLSGDPTEADYTQRAASMVPDLIKNYDGDTGKAMAAANYLVRNKPVPDELQPPMTNERIDQEAKLASIAVARGWPQSAINQAIAMGTTNTKKLADKYGWTPAYQKMIDDALPQEERRTRAQESSASAEQTRTQIQLREEAGLSAERVARSMKDIAEAMKAAKGANSVDMQKLLNQITAIKGLVNKPPNDPSLKAATEAIKNQLLTSVVDKDGVPLLHEEDIPAWFGLAKSRQFVIGGPVDSSAISDQNNGASPAGMPTTGVSSFLQPDVLSRVLPEMMNTGLTAMGKGIETPVMAVPKAVSAISDAIQELAKSEYKRQQAEAAKKK